MIKMESVRFAYHEGETDVIKGLNLSIAAGEFVAILGANGSGKSTLSKLMNGILLPSSGHVTAAGFDTTDEEHIFDIRRRIGMVFQNPDNQIVSSVVEDDVAFAPENLGVDPLEIRQRVNRALEAVGLLEHRTDTPNKLSGGQKQRVAIAGVLAMEPECLVLDEPTAMLDPRGRESVMKIIKKLHRENNVTVILVTHYMEEAAQADRILVLKEGEILVDGTPVEVFGRPDEIKEAGLELPPSVVISRSLSKNGVGIDKTIPEMDQLAEQIIEWNGSKNAH